MWDLHLKYSIMHRLRAQSKRSRHSHNTGGFSESLEAIDSTMLPPEDGGGDCIELNEIQADKEIHFKDTTPTG